MPPHECYGILYSLFIQCGIELWRTYEGSEPVFMAVRKMYADALQEWTALPLHQKQRALFRDTMQKRLSAFLKGLGQM